MVGLLSYAIFDAVPLLAWNPWMLCNGLYVEKRYKIGRIAAVCKYHGLGSMDFGTKQKWRYVMEYQTCLSLIYESSSAAIPIVVTEKLVHLRYVTSLELEHDFSFTQLG